MKKVFPLLFSVSVFLLTGCSSVNGLLGEKVLQYSGIYKDADFQKYEEMKEAGYLDEQGYYIGEEMEEGTRPADKVRVTFAENAYLKLTYYYDAALTKPVDTSHPCYLNPGESLYASEPVSDNPNSNRYGFHEFRLWEYDPNGSRSVFSAPKGGEANLVLTIPQNFTGKELSVEPLGKYENLTLSFSDYYIDRSGNRIELNGSWEIDDEPVVGESAEIDSVGSYVVAYDFSGYCEDYYFETSKPASYYTNDQSGRVIFKEASAKETEEDNYEVQLHRYITAGITNEGAGIFAAFTDSIREIKVNGTSVMVSKSKEQSIKKLKCGDKIEIKVGSDYQIDCGLNAKSSRVEITDGYEYTITVPDTLESDFPIAVNKTKGLFGITRKK